MGVGAIASSWDMKTATRCNGTFGENFDRWSRNLNNSEKLYNGLEDLSVFSCFTVTFLNIAQVFFSGKEELRLCPCHALFFLIPKEKDSQL